KNWDGFTIFLAGDSAANENLQQAFQKHTHYWLRRDQAPSPASPSGFGNTGPTDPGAWAQLTESEKAKTDWHQFGLATMAGSEESVRTATDDWPFLYLHHPMIPNLSLRGIALMGGIAVVFLLIFMPQKRDENREMRDQSRKSIWLSTLVSRFSSLLG